MKVVPSYWVMVVGAIIVAAIACGGNGGSEEGAETPTALECGKEEATALKAQVEPLIERFDDVAERANATSRIALSPVIGEMQEVRRDFKALEMHPCAEEAQSLMVDYMDKVIDAFLAFLGDESDAVVSDKMDEARRAQSQAVTQWAIVFAAAEEQ